MSIPVPSAYSRRDRSLSLGESKLSGSIGGVKRPRSVVEIRPGVSCTPDLASTHPGRDASDVHALQLGIVAPGPGDDPDATGAMADGLG